MFRELLVILFVIFHFATTASIAGPPPPQWASTWMATASGHSLTINRTISVQVFYDWTRPAQVLNLMKEDAYSYTILHNATTVWKLNRANRSCCVDPNHSGVTPLNPDWLQNGNKTVYDGVVTVMEHDCHSWTKTVPDVATFSWLTSVATGVPCRLAWPNVMYTDFSYYSEDRNLFPNDIFQVPDYCPREVTDPNCNAMRF